MAGIVSGPSPLDWKVYAGDRNEASFTFKAADQVWDLTGAQLTAQARLSAIDPKVGMTATITPIDEATGTYTIGWDGDVVTTLLAGLDSWKGVWDLQVLEAGQTQPTTLLRGKFEATMDVTKDVG